MKRNVGFKSSWVMSYCIWHMGGVSAPWGLIGLVVCGNGKVKSGLPAGRSFGPESPGAFRLGAVAPSLNREKLNGEQLKLFSRQLFPVQGAARW